MNNLTILIPSHLKKLKILDFILMESKNFKVILVSNKKFKNKYSNVKYIKTSYINVIDKINHGLSYIKTDNILLLPDDELPIFSSIIHIYNQYKKNEKIDSKPHFTKYNTEDLRKKNLADLKSSPYSESITEDYLKNIKNRF